MPPLPFEYRGIDAAREFLMRVVHLRGPRRLVHTRANGQPAFGIYVLDERVGIYRAVGLGVATLAGEKIAALTRFETSLLSDFGLPRNLHS